MTTTVKQTHSEYANWIIPKILMCGPYPFTDGINFSTLDEGMKNMRDILADGIDTFVCLCRELPDTTTKYEGSPTLIKHPYFPHYLHYRNYFDEKSLMFRYFPIDDGSVNDLPTMVKYVKTLINDLKQGRRIYIHCAGGHGRTNIFTSILYSIHYSVSPENAINDVFFLRSTRQKHDKKLEIYGVNPKDVKRVFTEEQRSMAIALAYYFHVQLKLV